MKTNRTLVIVAIVLAIVAVVIAVVVREDVGKFPDGSPQKVVQQYLQAFVEGDHDTAAQFFAADSKCTAADLDRTYTTKDVRVDLVNVAINGDSALVKVAVGLGSEGPFDSLYLEDHVYRLTKTSGEWRLTGVPWPLYECGMVKY